MPTEFQLRRAVERDAPALEALIDESVGLLGEFYSQPTLAEAMGAMFGLDRQLIADGTYFLVETAETVERATRTVGCGGWSMRDKPYGGSVDAGPAPLLDPRTDAARIRAFFVHPEFARRGIGSRILRACEDAIAHTAFTRIQIAATLAGERLYAKFGYRAVARTDVAMATGEPVTVVTMTKPLAAP